MRDEKKSKKEFLELTGSTRRVRNQKREEKEEGGR